MMLINKIILKLLHLVNYMLNLLVVVVTGDDGFAVPGVKTHRASFVTDTSSIDTSLP